MFALKSWPKVLLFLAGFVFFSANSIYILEADSKEVDSFTETITFDFDHIQKGPYLNLKSAILINYDNGQVIYSKNADTKRSIASLSKLVTAMVLIDSGIPLDSVVSISKKDARNSSRSRLRRGYELTLMDLLHATLLSSDNRAARAIARTVSGSYEAFGKAMTRKVRELGLSESVFHEPSGLDKDNVSTAHEVAKILHYAYRYKLIKEITSKKLYYVKVRNKKNKKLQMVNTNIIVHSRYKVLTGKTGYIQASDYCLTTLVKNKQGERLSLVVLGVPGDKLRFKEARRLLDWGFRKI